ncbi:MAG: hypothetical protein R3B81_16580 [bacterium]
MALATRLFSVLALAALSFLVPPQVAAGGFAGITVGWGDTDWSYQSDIYMDCMNPTDTTLVVSFAAARDLEGVTVLEGHVDFCTYPFDLPEWWQFEQAGGCREGGLGVDADFSAGPSTHTDPWQGNATVTYDFISPHLTPDRARIAVRVETSEPVSLAAFEEYYAFRVEFRVPNPGSCAGCQFPACFVINDAVDITHAGGVESIKGNAYSNYASWMGHPGCSFVISVQPSTWGRIKADYR